MRSDGKLKIDKIVVFYLLLVLVIFMAGIGVVYLDPINTKFMHQEDLFIENLTVGICLGTFVLGIILLFKNYSQKKILAAASFASLLGFLDEISYGERIFGIKFPLILGKKVDGIHDLLAVVKKFIAIEIIQRPDRHFAIKEATIFLIFSSSIALICFISLCRLNHFKLIPSFSYLILLFSFTVFLVVSQLMDLGLSLYKEYVKNIYGATIEEIFELFVSLSLLFTCLLVKSEKR